MSEASLEVNTRYRNDLEEEKARLYKDVDRLKGKVATVECCSAFVFLSKSERKVTDPGPYLTVILFFMFETKDIFKQKLFRL